MFTNRYRHSGGFVLFLFSILFSILNLKLTLSACRHLFTTNCEDKSNYYVLVRLFFLKIYFY